VRVFNGCRLAIARGKPCLARRWEDVTRHESFEWKTKRDAMRIKVVEEGYLATSPPALSVFAESEGYEPADFDRRINISGDSASTVEIDENMLLEPCLISSRSCRANETMGAIALRALLRSQNRRLH
jgi:hypothetical protein